MAHRWSIVLAPLALAMPAWADFTGLTVVDVSGDVVTPAGLVTYRLIAHFDDPADEPLYVGSGPTRPLLLSTTDPEGFRNDAGLLAGTQGDDFPNVPIGEAWDSWVALGGTTFATNAATFTPSFAGGAVPAIVGSEVAESNGGWYVAGWPGGIDVSNLVIGQFTVAEGHDVELTGTISWNDPRNGLRTAWLSTCPTFTTTSESVVTCGRVDLNGDRQVGLADLLEILAYWGDCPTTWQPTSGAQLIDAYLDPCGDSCGGRHFVYGTGFGRFDSMGELAGAAGETIYNGTTAITSDGDGALLSIGGGGSAISFAECGESATSGALVTATYEFEVLEPIPYELIIVTCDVSIVRLTGPDDFEIECANSTGVLEPGSYTFYGRAYPSSFEPGVLDQSVFTAHLTLTDAGCSRDVDGDGVIGFGDLIAILSAWGPCGE